MLGNLFFWSYLLLGALMALVCFFILRDDFALQEELETIRASSLIAGFSFVLAGLAIAFWLRNLASFTVWGSATACYWMHILLVLRARASKK